MVLRSLKLPTSNSFFLFGPRGTGKTTLILEQFSDPSTTLYIDLLDVELMDQLLLDPLRFRDIIDSPEHLSKRVIIDEVQKFPKILDVVQSQIRSRKRQFILTGSSSRKLMQQSSNLLAGRAWVYHLYPLSVLELPQDFRLRQLLELGGLPDACLASEQISAREYLNAYVATYLHNEIQQEQWVRKLEPFRKFLAVAAQMNGKIVNMSKISKQVGVHDTTIANYFEILEQTLLGFYLPAFHTSVRKAQSQAPKFYFCDTGIKRALDKTLSVDLLPQTYAWGDAFEHLVIVEFIRGASYCRFDWSFSYARTPNDVEIDLIIDRPGQKRLMVEIKSANLVDESDAFSLESLGRDLDSKAEKWLLSLDPLERKFGTTRAVYWKTALHELFHVSKI